MPRRNSLKLAFREDIRRTRHGLILVDKARHAESRHPHFNFESQPREGVAIDQRRALMEDSQAYEVQFSTCQVHDGCYGTVQTFDHLRAEADLI